MEVLFDGKIVSLEVLTQLFQVFDTAGQEAFSSLANTFYRNAECCVITYDITDSQSFDAVEKWKSAFIDGCNP